MPYFAIYDRQSKTLLGVQHSPTIPQNQGPKRYIEITPEVYAKAMRNSAVIQRLDEQTRDLIDEINPDYGAPTNT
jgi:hypothetical protein